MVFQSSFGQALRSDTIDVINYKIDLHIISISQHEISGSTELLINPKINNLGKFGLDFLHMQIDSIQVNGTQTTSWNYNDTLLSINLGQAFSQADTFTTKIFYHGSPVVDPSGWGGFYFSSDNLYAFNMGVGFADSPHNYGRIWFPCVDDFHDRATYDFSIETTSSLMAVCNGTLQEVLDHGATKTYKWKLNNTIPTYLANVAIGPYVLVADTFNGVLADVPIGIYVPSSKVLAAQGSFANLKSILANYEMRYGPYRWERVGYVAVPFSSGAMEHSTNISLGLVYINGGLTYQSLIAHELSHQWFGNLVTTSTAPEMWINEGWAVFSEGVTIEGLEGKEAYKNFMRNLSYNVIKSAHTDDGGYFAVANVPHQVTYGSTSYDKGATIAHSIRGYLGDSLFFDMLHNYFQTYKYNHINTLEFRDFISQSSGINMNDFFQTWVLEPGFPHFSVDSFQVQPSGNKYLVTIFFRQKLHQKPSFSNSNRIWVELGDQNWQKQMKLASFSGETGSSTFLLDFAPSYCLIDPQEQYCDATHDFRRVIKTTGTINFSEAQFNLVVNSISDSVLFRITHNLVAPDTNGTNLPGLKISTRRYWDVNGIFPQGFNATGKFLYSKTNFDGDILIGASDSLVMLYREGPGHGWVGVPFTKTGSWSAGTLVVPNLQKGEYALAIWDALHAGSMSHQDEFSIEIFPNPAVNQLFIKGLKHENYEILITDAAGKFVESIRIEKAKPSQKLDLTKLKSGSYLLNVYDKKGVNVFTSKFLFTR